MAVVMRKLRGHVSVRTGLMTIVLLVVPFGGVVLLLYSAGQLAFSKWRKVVRHERMGRPDVLRSRQPFGHPVAPAWVMVPTREVTRR